MAIDPLPGQLELPMKKVSETEHVKTVGETKYRRAFIAALIEVRKDNRLIGLDKFRHALAHEAALRATGFPQRPLHLKRSLGPTTEEAQRAGEEILEGAIIAAQN